MDKTEGIDCPNCGAHVPQDFKYCGRCGTELRMKRDTPTAERRQITVMFCDLVGSTPLSHMLDPEDFAAIVLRYQEACVDVVEGHGGFVAQYLGDGILAYFGYPTTDERIADEAVRAGLEVLGRVGALSTDIEQEYGLTLSARIGIHTGLVVVDDMGSGAHRERLALGETPNIAARIQAAAPTDALVVSRETFHLVEASFVVEDLGQHVLRGREHPIKLYRILEERYEDGLVDSVEPIDMSDGAGREEHVQQLLLEWDAAAAGRGRAVFLAGEAGIGKSHLVQHVRTLIGSQRHYGVVCRCASNLAGSAFHPLVEWFARVLNFYPDQPEGERMDMIRFLTERHGLADDDAVPLLGSLLTQATLSDLATLNYSAARARARTEGLLEKLIFNMSADRPLLFVMEDVQWIDPSTRAFLLGIAQRMADRPVLLLLTGRALASFDWPPSCPFMRIDLERMTAEQIDSVIAGAAQHRSLPQNVIERIREKAEGVPLYAQEFTKMVIESDTLEEDESGFHLRDDLPELRIPSSLQDSLMARLDRLMPVKEVAQICSIFGRTFTEDLVWAAAAMPSASIHDALDRLVAAQLLVQEGTSPSVRYRFRHTLLQEAAYDSIIRSQKARYHDRVASYLKEAESAGDRVAERRTEDIALHLTAAGVWEEAAQYWCRAGSEAQERWANEEATDYYRRGLALLTRVAPTDDLRRTAFQLNVGLAAASLQQKGYSHPDVAAASERAAELASNLHDAEASIPAVLGLWAYYTVTADHVRAEVLAERMGKLAQLARPSLNAFSAQSTRAITWFWQGEIRSAKTLLETLLSRYEDTRHVAPSGLSYQHPVVGVLSYLSLIRWCQGDVEEAAETGREAMRTAEEIEHPFSLAFASGFNAVLQVYLGEIDAAHEMAARTVDVSERHGFAFWYDVGSVLLAWSNSHVHPERAIVEMREGLRRLDAAGVHIWKAFPTALMAELLGRQGRSIEAINELDDLLGACELHGEYNLMPEMRRLRARLLDDLKRDDEAAREREYALSLARAQGAHSLTLRILNDALRYDVVPSPGLHDILRSTVDYFPTHLDSEDLVEARQLLTASSVLHPSTSARA